MTEHPTVVLPEPETPRTGRSRRKKAWLAGLVVPLLIVPAVVAIGAVTASGDEVPEGGTSDTGHALADDRPRLPAELRSDLADLVRADPEDRPELRAEIGDKARAGDYGDRVQEYAARVDERRAALPEDLQADIERLQEADQGERRDIAEEIRDGIFAGEYGDEVQEQAEALRDLVVRHRLRDVVRDYAR